MGSPNGRKPRTDFSRALTLGWRLSLEAEFAMLSVAIDDSDDGDRIVLLGGLIASVEAWEELQDRWNGILARDERFTHWHQSDAWAQKESPWDILKDKAIYDAFIADFSDAIVAAKPRGLSVWLDLSDWRAVVPTADTIPIHRGLDTDVKWRLACQHFSDPYSMLGGAICLQIEKRLRELDGQPRAGVIIEAGSPVKNSSLSSIFEWFDGEWQKDDGGACIQIATIMKGKSPESRPLEAADLYAWAQRRALRRELDGKPPEPLWSKLSAHTEPRNVRLSRELIRGWYESFAFKEFSG